MADRETLGRRLKQMRRERALTQVDLGKKVNMSGSHISLIERGKRKPSMPMLNQLATLFQVDLLFLLYGIDVKQAQDTLQQVRSKAHRCAHDTVDDVFATCSASDIIVCETRTLPKFGGEVTTITLIKVMAARLPT
ncbi:helix-turn-helix domain-containing protein [Nonomuraea sp. NPDC003707]